MLSLRWTVPATFLLLMTVFFAEGYGAPASGQVPTAPRIYVDDELLVKFAPDTLAFEIRHAHERAGGKVVRDVPALGVQVVKVGQGRAPTTLDVYLRDPNVEYAELNTIYRVLDDPFYPTQWGLINTGQLGGTPDADMDATDAWPLSTGAGIKIAVLDTGIRMSHEEIGPGKVVLEANFSTSSTPEDNHGHGTHVSTTAAGLSGNGLGIHAVAPDALLMNGKVLSDTGSGSCDSVANGINWAVANGAQVVNMSLGGGSCITMEKALNDAWNAGVVLTCAAGNGNSTIPTYPAGYENCIAVAATDRNDQRASFSNYGNWVDVAAPGVGIAAGIAPAPEVDTSHLGLLFVTSSGNQERDARPLLYSETTPGNGIEASAIYAGLGDVSDFSGVDCLGKIAVIQRGTLTFATKVMNAKNAGCIGAVIFNNGAGNFNGTLGAAGDWLPTLSIAQGDGEELVSMINVGPTTLRIVVKNDYAEWSGTSMAAPHVAGTAALVRAACPGASAATVRFRIESTADAIPGTGSLWANGRINAGAAVDSCFAPSPTPSPNPSPSPAPSPDPTPSQTCTPPLLTAADDTNPSGGGTVSIAWSPVAAATEYKVQRQNSNGSWNTRLTTSGTSFGGADHPSDPLWRVFVSRGDCTPVPGPATVFDP